MNDFTQLPLRPADEKLILQNREIISRPVTIRLLYADTPEGSQIRAFCETIETLLPSVTVVREAAEDDSPGILVGENMYFMMVPTGKMLDSFLFALLGNETLASQETGVDAAALKERITLPAALKMYVMDNCSFCGAALPKVLFLAGAVPGKIRVRVIDVMMFSGLATSDRVMSAPTTIVDNTFRWSGDFRLEEVVETIASRNPVQLGYDTLKMMIADGGAKDVARIMEEFNMVIPAFTDLLTAEKWPERLGAMVSFEYLVEKKPELAETVLDMVWKTFDTFDTAVMGDMVHLVGVLNRKSQVGRLRSVLEGSYPEAVRQVAGEVLEKM